MKKIVYALLFAAIVISCATKNTEPVKGGLPGLKISENGRYFMTENGDPFFWLGDTGWLICSKMSREDVETYLENRRKKGFNIVQIMVLHSLGITSVYGDSALVNNDVSQPLITEGSDFADSAQYDYWDHMDYIVDLAEQKGLYAALVPVWGSAVQTGLVTQQRADAYGKWIANRYKDKSNIIWLNGGDIKGSDSLAVWNVLGNAINTTDTTHLITYHPRGRTASTMWFHNENWLDFNMFQSGHRNYAQGTDAGQKDYGEDNWRFINDDYVMTPAKPTLDGEPSYENIPQGLHDSTAACWGASDVRRYGYWSVFAGGAGYTYGENSIMQFLSEKDKGSAFFAKLPWQEAINAEGAGQMHFLKDLMLSRSYFDRVPDQTLVAGENGEKYDYVVATRGNDYAMMYIYTGRPFSVNMGKIAGEEVVASWFSPRDGKYTEVGSFPNTDIAEFTPPSQEDWVLVLDSKK